MLEVNPKYTDPSYEDFLNVIDARWIDIETGLFIDITAVRPHHSKKGIMCSKDQHEEKVRPVTSLLITTKSPNQKNPPPGPRSLPPPRLRLRRPTRQDPLQLRPPPDAGIRQRRPHEDGIFRPPLQFHQHGVGAVHVSELPRQSRLPGVAGPAARRREASDEEMRWLTRPAGLKLTRRTWG